MSEITKLARKITTRDKMLEAISEYKKAELEYAIELCPFETGDKVEVLGYSHKGKYGIIDKIIGYDSTKWEKSHWKVFGSVLKKSGEISQHRFEFLENDYNKRNNSIDK